MKKTLIVALAALMLFACGRETTFTIVGTMENPEMEGMTISLYKTIDGTPTFVESTEIIDGAYTFTSTIETPISGSLRVGEVDERQSLTGLIFERGTIKVTTDIDGRTQVTGTRNNDLRQEFWNAEHTFQAKMMENSQALQDAQQAGNEELVATLSERQSEYFSQLHENRLDFAKNNINNFAGQNLFGMLSRIFSIEELQAIIANANRRTLEIPEVATAVERLEILQRTAVGQPFVDLTMPDPDGNYISISDFVGEGYLMIDFTATWCGPCRVGKPAMIETFNRFNDRGFNIIGVWFDRDHDAWINGMAALNMPDWPQMSDLNFWQSEGARLYAISSIPHSVLIDPNGIIIARSLRGEDLNEKLEELLGSN